MSRVSSVCPARGHLGGPGRLTRTIACVEHFFVRCPYCGETVEIYVEPDVRGSFVQDCEVCCNPWRVTVQGRDDDREVNVMRADGSE